LHDQVPSGDFLYHHLLFVSKDFLTEDFVRFYIEHFETEDSYSIDLDFEKLVNLLESPEHILSLGVIAEQEVDLIDVVEYILGH